MEKRLGTFFAWKKSTWLAISSVLAGTLILCVPAFYNGYPLLFQDTGGYIWNLANAILHRQIPMNHPIMYSFLLGSGLYRSLWPPLFAQSLLVACLLYVCTALLIERDTIDASVRKAFLFITLFLSLFSSISWTATHMLPDAFTGVIVLVVSVLGVYRFPTLPRGMKILISLATIWMIMTHGSHMLVVPGMVVLLGVVWLKAQLLAKWIKPLRTMIPVLKRVAWRYLLAIAILPWLLTPLVNLGISGEWQYVKGSPVFLTARLVEAGVAKPWLEENCHSHAYMLCAYRENLAEDAGVFLWHPNGPVQQIGGWGEIDIDEWKTLNKNILTTPRHAVAFAGDSIRKTMRLVSLHNLQNERGPFRNLPSRMVGTVRSKQYQDQLATPLRVFSVIHALVSVISLFVLLFYFCSPSRNKLFSPRFRLAILWGVSGILLNALVCASISGAYWRYNTRVIWLLPFFAVLCIVVSAMRRNTSKSNDIVISAPAHTAQHSLETDK